MTFRRDHNFANLIAVQEIGLIKIFWRVELDNFSILEFVADFIRAICFIVPPLSESRPRWERQFLFERRVSCAIDGWDSISLEYRVSRFLK